MRAALWRVRVVTTSRVFTPYSADLPLPEATALQQRTRQDARDCGDGPGFITFARNSGVPVEIRGRDVIAVEIVPPGRDRQPASLPPFRDELPALAVTNLTAMAGPATQFLRSIPGRHPQVQPNRQGDPR